MRKYISCLAIALMMLVSVFTQAVVNAENLYNLLDMDSYDDSINTNDIEIQYLSQFGGKLNLVNPFELEDKLGFSFTEEELLKNPKVYFNHGKLYESNKLNTLRKYLYANDYSTSEEMFAFDSSFLAEFEDGSLKYFDGLKKPITLQYILLDDERNNSYGIFRIEGNSIYEIKSQRIVDNGTTYLEFSQEDLASIIITPLKSREVELAPEFELKSSLEEIEISKLENMEDLKRLGIEFTVDELLSDARVYFEINEFNFEEVITNNPHKYKNLVKYIMENNLGETLFGINIDLYKEVNYHSETIKEINEHIEFTFKIPDELKDKEFILLNFHEGSVIYTVYSINLEENTITIKANKFSPFVFVEKKSNDESSGKPPTDNEDVTEDENNSDDEPKPNEYKPSQDKDLENDDDSKNDSAGNDEPKNDDIVVDSNKESEVDSAEPSKENEIIEPEVSISEQLPTTGAPSIIVIAVPLVLIGLTIILITRKKNK